LAEFTEETVPCTPEREHWAKWLAALPNEDWDYVRPEGVADGEVFEAFTMQVVAELRYRWDGQRLSPEGAHVAFPDEMAPDWFAVRDGQTWDAERSHPDLKELLEIEAENYLGGWSDEADELVIAAIHTGPSFSVAFTRAPAPALTTVTVQ
jgi:hypothetical protein